MAAAPQTRVSSTIDWPWTAAVAVAGVLATAAAAGGLVADADAVRAGELWRLATGSLVHATAGHLVRDVGLLVIVGAAYERTLRRGFGVLIGLLLVGPPIAVFCADPDLRCYYGLSGLTHGLIAAALAFELSRRRAPWWVWAIAGAFAFKLAFELATGAPLFPMSLGPGVRQVPVAHAAGAAIGTAWALLRCPPHPDPPRQRGGRQEKALPRVAGEGLGGGSRGG